MFQFRAKFLTTKPATSQKPATTPATKTPNAVPTTQTDQTQSRLMQQRPNPVPVVRPAGRSCP
ncbi:MAG TPA: hypothetical protein VN612_04015 [Acidobacteriaceae bacterium]|nr:hypothetical protein [Acidobacteriaceae bacterium]